VQFEFSGLETLSLVFGGAAEPAVAEIAAKRNQATLVEDGVDVTFTIAVGP
jgi:hypothetical protein